MSGTMLAAGDTVASKSPTFTELRGVVSKFQSLQVPVGKKGFPGGASGKEHACQCSRHKRHRFDPWVGKILWRRAWLPTPVFLPGESPWTEEPGGL